MLEQLNEIEKAALESLSAITDSAALDAWRVANVGRSSPLMRCLFRAGKTLKGGATSCRRGGEPCEGGA